MLLALAMAGYGAGVLLFGGLSFVGTVYGMPLWQAVLFTLLWPLSVPAMLVWDRLVR